MRVYIYPTAKLVKNIKPFVDLTNIVVVHIMNNIIVLFQSISFKTVLLCDIWNKCDLSSRLSSWCKCNRVFETLSQRTGHSNVKRLVKVMIKTEKVISKDFYFQKPQRSMRKDNQLIIHVRMWSWKYNLLLGLVTSFHFLQPLNNLCHNKNTCTVELKSLHPLWHFPIECYSKQVVQNLV